MRSLTCCISRAATSGSQTWPVGRLSFRTVAALLSVLLGAPSAPGQSLLHQIPPETPNSRFGLRADAAGDANGDGVPDLVASGVYQLQIISGSDGSTLVDVPDGSIPGTGFYAPVSGAGDVNQDGHDDVVVGMFLYNWLYFDDGGARIYSGKDGALLLEVHGFTSNAQLGYDVDGVGDVDGDGVPDFAAGAVDEDLGNTVGGVAYVFSGSDGHVIHTLTGKYAGPEGFGYRVAALGDLDLDGVPDIAATSSAEASYVRRFSGADGSVLDDIPEPVDGSFGFDLESAGDFDTDGVPDLLIGVLADSSSGQSGSYGLGAAYVFSGYNPVPIYTFLGGLPSVNFGNSVSAGQDLDGDGIPDMLVAAWQCGNLPEDCQGQLGYVKAYSGADGSELFTLNGDPAGSDGFGASCAIIGDVNGDSIAEFAIGSNLIFTVGLWAGMTEIYSPIDLPLTANKYTFDLSTGGNQFLRLQPGIEWAGSPYFLVGTATGIVPGTPAGGFTAPINIDAYTLLTLTAPNLPPLTTSFGVIGVDGKAVSTFSFPPGLDPGLAGTTLHHSFLLFAGDGTPSYVSNAAPMHFIP